MLKQGDRAPSFNLESDAGERISLKGFAGRPVVIYFYPKDDTPGCTREAIAFSKVSPRIAAMGASVVGISKDSVSSHCKFKSKYGLRIPLLSDPDLSVHEAFGAYGEKSMYGKKVMGTIRSTFVVDAEGRIARVFPSVKVDGHEEAVIEALGALGAGESENSKPKKTTAGPKKANASAPRAAARRKPPAKTAARKAGVGKPRRGKV